MGKPLLGLKILELRKAQKMSQEDLAAKSGVARTTIQGLQKGNERPSISTLDALAKALNTKAVIYFANSEEESLLDLFGRANPTNRALILGYARGLLDAHQD
jgi:transcriptional regulator with XRE-family HTH domain